jgi:hypothetical protein
MQSIYATTPRARVDGEQSTVRGSSMGVLLVTQVGTTGGPASVAQSTDISNTMRSTALSTASVSATASTAVSTAATPFLAANAARKGVSFTNMTAATLLLDSSTALSTANFAYAVNGGGGFYEWPQPVYSGAIYAILTAASTLLVAPREYI